MSLVAIGVAPFVVFAKRADRTVRPLASTSGAVQVHHAVAHDRSEPLGAAAPHEPERGRAARLDDRDSPRSPAIAARAPGEGEQTKPGDRAPARLVASFDGLGAGFAGPQGTSRVRNPSDNSLAPWRDTISWRIGG